MKKIPFFALLSIFALATSSCNKEPTEVVDKTEYDVFIFIEGYEKESSGSYNYNKPVKLEDAKITLIDYGTTATTDRDGKATLKLQRGEYRITVEKSRYKAYSHSSDDIYEGTLDVYGNMVESYQLYEK